MDPSAAIANSFPLDKPTGSVLTRGHPPDGAVAPALALAERVRLAVDELPADQQVAIRLAYFGGKTYRQVADVLGIPEGTAKSRLRMGLRRMAEALEREGVDQWR